MRRAADPPPHPGDAMTTPGHAMIDLEALLSERMQAMEPSGIRRVFELASKMRDPVNFSIGQPDFDVPEPIKQAAIDAIRAGRNGYTITQGIAELRAAVAPKLSGEFGWEIGPGLECDVLITNGTSAGLLLAYTALADPGDEIIIPDPYFVSYPQVAAMVGAVVRYCDTYPDFRMTAARLEPLLTDRTKFVVLNSPGNPSGVVLSSDELREIVDLCESRGVLLLSDEIYDEFTYGDGREAGVFPTPARFSNQMLVLRGFSKTWGMTGWRLGYAVGPSRLIREMTKVNQYSFVCAPHMVQHAGVVALRTDMSSYVAAYERKRDMVVEALGGLTEIAHPAGAFYAFPRVPQHLSLTGDAFFRKALERNVLVIPGNIFSQRDTHFRISYAVDDARLARGLEILAALMK